MANSGPFPSWDSFPNWDALSSFWASAAGSALTSGPAGAYTSLFDTLRKQVIGRRMTVKLKSGEMTLTVTALDADLDVRSLSVGQLNTVSISASDIVWNGWQFDKATAVLHNTHIKPTNIPVLVAAPLDLTIEMSTTALDKIIDRASSLPGRAAPRLLGRIDAGGVAQIRWARTPDLGHLEVDATIDGSTLLVKPRMVALRRARWHLPNRLPAYRIQLPKLPRELTPTSVDFSPETLRLTGRMPQWRVEVPHRRIEEAIDQLNQVGKALNLSWMARGL
ncbi:hypothetical protein MTY66_05400 [Mycolicibacterium sp. TY66]|uniref:hypothetical protein n=1 Tax=Mycobacteriaceae TaxID=1762 RepID=UPI00076A4495|nr:MULTISPECIES: hypothetical protein [Mycolicibacterium]BCI78915.1 hypothetical protein MTY66_05400 [Mycolicibacterium sp. TY66]BCJ83424.1 hypothetical protein MTY81_47970 [Mycolicibacterium sp. TY81]